MFRSEVTAPARLHFGLLNPNLDSRYWPTISNGKLPVRSYGGCGVMLESPSLQLTIQEHPNWQAEGPQAGRALEFAQAVLTQIAVNCKYKITIHSAPREHSGLGTGTTLGLAIAKAICLHHHIPYSPLKMAPWVNRGARSAIGIHGSETGGFIVDFGKLPEEPISPMVQSIAVPTNWYFVLAQPKSAEHWHGDRERHAFTQIPAPELSHIDSLCRLLYFGIVPALIAQDFQGFSQALTEYNARVGLPFQAIQGGIYTSKAIADAVQWLQYRSIKGVGQSSWGPTVFALVTDQDHAKWLEQQLQDSNLVWINTTRVKPLQS